METVKAVKERSKQKRQGAIIAELRASPAIRIVELAHEHDVSTETIRRDLDELSAAGLINRTYGGATGLPPRPSRCMMTDTGPTRRSAWNWPGLPCRSSRMATR